MAPSLKSQPVTPAVDLQAPQAPEDRHGPDYNNDTPKNWLRGMPRESAEGKPSFDKANK